MQTTILRQFSAAVAATVIAFTGGINAVSAQSSSASNESISQAARKARVRLDSEGYTVTNTNNLPTYHTFMKAYTTKTVYVDIKTKGRYVLVVGSDNDTQDLDIELRGIGSDTSRASTGFVEFNVYKPGRLHYDIKMLGCRANNCGVYAALLSIGS